MTRDELIEVGARAWHLDSWKIDGDAVTAIIDAVEPLIRADERERTVAREADKHIATVEWNRQAVLADLRAQVKALRTDFPLGSYEEAIDDVIVLIDGSSGA